MGINHWQVSFKEDGRRKCWHFSTYKRALDAVQRLIENGNLPIKSASINIMLKTRLCTPPKKIDGIPFKQRIMQICISERSVFDDFFKH